ncbi:MAG: glyoxalase superfamily protein [candidate division KSB1 bacterium]
MSETQRTHFECCNPIFCVTEMAAAVRYYVEVLGFQQARWGDANFTCVTRDGASLYLSSGGQGQAGAWVWIGVNDVEQLHEELLAQGAIIRDEPLNYPWAFEMRVEDPDGNVLRFGSASKKDRPYDVWMP